MKVVRWSVTSIVTAVVLGVGAVPVAAEEVTEASCNEQYLLCINEASQRDGFWERTRAEARCSAAWYACVRRAVTGA